MAAICGSLSYTQRLILDQRWNSINQPPKHMQQADAERIRIEQKVVAEDKVRRTGEVK